MISLVIGLGNIGKQYKGTRHNIGFEVVEQVRKRLKASFEPSSETYDCTATELSERRIILAWPKTYMNRSGIAARVLLQDTDLQPSQMLVVLDDFNLPLGSLRFRQAGSDGGHKGLASIIEALETEDFPRLRLGIGPAPDNTDMTDFVLSRFTKEEIDSAKKMVAKAAEAVLFTIRHHLKEAMTRYNINPA